MPIPIVCPGCQSKIRVSENLVGRSVRCPQCSSPVPVSRVLPNPSSEPVFPTIPSAAAKSVDCGRCGRSIPFGRNMAGLFALCPFCGAHVKHPDGESEGIPAEGAFATEPKVLPSPTPVHITLSNTPERPVRDAAGHSLGIASFVLGLVSFVISLSPCAGVVALPLGLLGFVLGIFGFFVCFFRRGHGIGYAIAGLVTCAFSIGIAMVWLGGWAMLFGNAQAAIAVADKKAGKAPAAVEDDAWVDAAKHGARSEHVVVKVTGVEFDHVKLSGLGVPKTSKEKMLQVRVRVENWSDTKKVRYRSWGNTSTPLQIHAGKLKDNFGNPHQLAVWGFGTMPEEQTTTASILPGKSIDDVLVFDEPVAKASSFQLELPAGAFEGQGLLRFRIPYPFKKP